jgi:hypothetical protein
MAGLIVGLAGCGGGSGSGSSPDPSGTTGRISLGISDGPVHGATKVCIKFDEIELKGEGPSIIFPIDGSETVNLLDFQGANAFPILVNEEVPAGEYQWMRLAVDAVRGGGGGGDTLGDGCDGAASYLVMEAGTQHNLYIPSGANSGLKFNGGFTVVANSNVNLTAEFDLTKSFTAPPGLDPDVIMRPTVRLVNNVEVGTLTGQVSDELATEVVLDMATETEMLCEPSVYVFDDGVTPNGIVDGEEDLDDPVATAIVSSSVNAEGITEWHYTIGFLLALDYEVAFTCNGTDFEPLDGKPATIVAQEVTTVDFLEVPE